MRSDVESAWIAAITALMILGCLVFAVTIFGVAHRGRGRGAMTLLLGVLALIPLGIANWVAFLSLAHYLGGLPGPPPGDSGGPHLLIHKGEATEVSPAKYQMLVRYRDLSGAFARASVGVVAVALVVAAIWQHVIRPTWSGKKGRTPADSPPPSDADTK